MQHFKQFLKNFKFPTRADLQSGFNALTRKEFWILVCTSIVAFVSVVIILAKINDEFLVSVPAQGGSITEGIIGIPTLVNPVLALSDADKDLTSLVYSGLMRKMPDGTFVPDLAESYSVSPDGTRYTFIVRKGAEFQDGTPVTADDIVFTLEKVNDPLIKSPRQVQWQGVTVQKTDDSTVVFTLNQPYASFIDNTTLGILPMHLWSDLSVSEFEASTYNTKAVGSGPYKISRIARSADGVPQSYTLSSFNHFALGKPRINSITVISYSNEKDLVQALTTGAVNQAAGISPLYAQSLTAKNFNISTSVLPRMFGIFFNQGKNSILADKSVRQAIDIGLDRNALIQSVLSGYGVPIDSPLPQTMKTGSVPETDIAAAQALLTKAGWTKGADGILQKGHTTTVTTGTGKNKKTTQVTKGPATKLAFTITTGDTPELQAAANVIKDQLGALGMDVTIKVYEQGPLNQIIRSRNYEALLFGQIINHESDLFAFWDSSQRGDPGLNISLYNNQKADVLLQSAQKTIDPEERDKKYSQFETLFANDIPAVFIYSPQYIYILGSSVHTEETLGVSVPSDRFATIYSWYAQTDNVWKLFTHKITNNPLN